MTPTEQDKELREEIKNILNAKSCVSVDLDKVTPALRALIAKRYDDGAIDAILQLITANYTTNSEVQDLVDTSMADAADEASKAAINQLTMGGEWIPASDVAERERVARINEGQLFREAMIEHSTPAIYWGDRLDELREDKL